MYFYDYNYDPENIFRLWEVKKLDDQGNNIFSEKVPRELSGTYCKRDIKTLNGTVTVSGVGSIEYYAGWNEANIVKILDDWDNFEVSRVFRLDVEKYDKIMTAEKVVVLPTIIFYLDGDEAGRLQGNMKFQLETTTKELDKIVEDIYNEDKFN